MDSNIFKGLYVFLPVGQAESTVNPDILAEARLVQVLNPNDPPILAKQELSLKKRVSPVKAQFRTAYTPLETGVQTSERSVVFPAKLTHPVPK